MRMLIVIGLLIMMCGATQAQDAIDPKKLIGEWNDPGDKAKKQPQTALEFSADGVARFKIALKADDEFDSVVQQKYEVTGNKLSLTQNTRDGNAVRVFTVTKLTDEVLELTETGGKKFSMKRLKEAKKEPKEEKK